MPRFNKWLTGVKIETPVDRVAKKALTARLRAVRHYLSEAVAGRDEAEAIHQLRIWTRRSGAALRLFATAVPEELRQWMKKKLRKIRRTAGEVRDCDVHLDRLQSAGEGPPKVVVNTIEKQRRAASGNLQALRRRLRKHHRFEKQAAELVDGIAWPKRHSSRQAPPFGYWYRQEIAPLGDRLLELARQDLSEVAQLHEFRIAGKRLRYALELAGPALAARPHEQLYEELSTLQDRLGEVCDHLAAVDRIREWLADAKKPRQSRSLQELLVAEEHTLATSRRRFHRWWTDARRSRLAQFWAAAFE